ncbi:unnamed protein product, partial [Prorocentrum cordatum]
MQTAEAARSSQCSEGAHGGGTALSEVEGSSHSSDYTYPDYTAAELPLERYTGGESARRRGEVPPDCWKLPRRAADAQGGLVHRFERHVCVGDDVAFKGKTGNISAITEDGITVRWHNGSLSLLAAAAATDVAKGYVWVLADPTGRHTIGTEIDGGAQVLRTPSGLDDPAHVGQEGSSETNESQHMEGRPIALVMSKRMLQTGGAPRLWPRKWMRESGIAGAGRVAHEMRTLAKSLWLAGTAGQDNIGVLLYVEAIRRRLAGIVAAYANPTEPARDLTRYYTGQTLAADAVGPEMRSFVSRRPRRTERPMLAGCVDLRPSTAPVALLVTELTAEVTAGEVMAGKVVAGGQGAESSWRSEWRMRRSVHLIGWQGIERARCPFPWMMPSGIFASEFEEVATYLLDYQERMLRQDEVSPKTEPHLDPELKFHQKEYQRLVRMLFDIGMVDWTMSPKCRIGLFCVLKSDGKSLRLIVDARRVNEVFADPLGVGLLTAEGFSRGEVALPASMSPQPPEAVEYLSKLRLVAGTSDVANCFHCLRLRPEMSAHFGLPAAPVHVFGLEGTVTRGRRLGRTSLVYPVWAALPMGFTWSLWFAQRINELQTLRGASTPLGAPLHDRGPPLTVLQPETAAGQAQHYVHVDNLGILHTRRYEAGEAISSLQRHFAELGLVLHESAVTDETCKTLGVELLGGGLRSRVASDRWRLIRRAIEALLRRPKCSGWALEAAVGHCTFAGLASRGCLSVWHTAYAFMHKYRDGAGYLWDECLQELRAFKELMLFLESDRTRPWNPMVFETDSSVEGMGIAKAMWGPEDVSAVGRALERSRFKRSGGCGARESALEAAGFWRDTSGKWQVSDSDADPKPRAPGRGETRLAREDSHGSLASRLIPRAARGARLELCPPALRPSATGRKQKQMDAGCCNEVDDSGSTASEQSGGKRAVPKRAAALRKKTRQRRSKFLSETVTRAMDGGLNFLDASSVTKPERERCEREVMEFTDYCGHPPAWALRSAAQVDRALSQHFDYQFFQGHEAAKGEQALADLMYSRPEFGKWGPQKLPNARRALRGRRKRAPARSRRAWALGVWTALAWRLDEAPGLLMCAFLLLSLSAHCHPGGLMGMRSETGLADVCIALDNEWAQCPTPLWPLAIKGDPDGLVFTSEYPAYMRAFQSSVKELGMEDRIFPYQTRHSAPSIDASRGWRAAEEVQR